MPIRENTESRKRASRAYQARRKAAGWVYAGVWLHPFTVERLKALSLVYDSRDAAIEAAVGAFRGPEPE